ncbi:MAG TPA: alpha/beta fold hydrolase, partial [Rhodospirillales bacterium]|nr:alpha/beta fold hydrolase [Rhodospirillales bacterium]
WHHQAETLADLAEISIADVTREDQAGPMAQRILAEAPEEFALAGLSMGGYLAFEILRQAPDRVLRLALLDTSARADPPEKVKLRQDLIELARTGEFKGVTPRLLPRLIHPARLGDAALVDSVLAMAERVGREAFLRQERLLLLRPDSRHDLALIHCPTLVLCGRQDGLTPLADSIEMAEKIPRAKLVVVEDCGHLSTMERPRAVSAVLRYWLQI